MIIGIGADILEIKRISEILNKHDKDSSEPTTPANNFIFILRINTQS